MGALTPFPHSIKYRFVIVDDDVNALRLERLHLRVGDIAADLKDHVVLVVKAGHLSTPVSPRVSLCGFFIYWENGYETSQSIHTSGAFERDGIFEFEIWRSRWAIGVGVLQDLEMRLKTRR